MNIAKYIGIPVLLSFAFLCQSAAYADINMDFGPIFSVGLRASTIATGDLDGDGDLDLAVANIYSHSLSLAFNDGNGNFNTITELPLDTGRKHPIALTIGDLDNYGNMDIAVAFIQNLDRTGLTTPAQSGIIFFYWNDDGTYTQIYQPVGGIPSSLKIEDMDGDGDDDLLIGNNGELDVDQVTGAILVVESGMYMFENMGRGLFSSATPKLTFGSVVDFLPMDYNGDGYKDIIGVSQGTTGFDNNFNMIYVDMCLETFQGSETGLGESNPDYVDFIPWSLDKGDFNKDGTEDLVISNTGTVEGLASFTGNDASFILYENKGNRFSALSSIPTPGIAFAVLADDFDLDGDVDVIGTVEEIIDVGGSARLDATLRIYENDGTGTLTETASLPLAEEPRYATKGDFDNDGDTDVAVLCTILDSAGSGNALNGEVYVFFNNARTEITAWELF